MYREARLFIFVEDVLGKFDSSNKLNNFENYKRCNRYETTYKTFQLSFAYS